MATPDHVPPPRACRCDADPGVFGHMSYACEHTMFPPWVTDRIHADRARRQAHAEAAIARGEDPDLTDPPAAAELAVVLSSNFVFGTPAKRGPG